MSRIIKSAVLLLALAFAVSSVSEARIIRVAKRLNVIEFTAGYSHPVGSYHTIGTIDFRNNIGVIVDIDADRVYDPTFHLGISYGQLRGGHLLYSIGFRYTKIETLDTFVVDPYISYLFDPVKPSFNQYDVDFNLNFLAADIAKAPIAPYVGIGFHGGITAQTATGFQAENWVTLALSLNFGADFKIWGAPKGRSLVTLSSVNSIDLLASNHRPRYLNIGGGLKYYFRP